MFTKITSDNIKSIKLGDTLLKYPSVGNPVVEVDPEDKGKMTFMQVSKIEDQTIDLLFSVPTRSTIAGLMLNMGPLHKNKKRMIQDESWWIISN